MPFASKSAQRLAGSMNYKGNESTLTNDSYKKVGNMGSKAPDRLIGNIASGSPGKKLYGSFVTSSGSSGLTGDMSEGGYTSGPKWKRAMEPGEFQPGKASQAKNTTRMTLGKDEKPPVMKVTSKTPKALRGGR